MKGTSIMTNKKTTLTMDDRKEARAHNKRFGKIRADGSYLRHL